MARRPKSEPTTAPVLALDIGTRMGFSLFIGGRLARAGLVRLGDDRGTKFRTYRRFLRLALQGQYPANHPAVVGTGETAAPAIICHEQLFIPFTPRGRTHAHATVNSLLHLFGFVAIAEEITESKPVLVRSCNVQSLRSVVAGGKSVDKAQVALCMQQAGFLSEPIKPEQFDLTDAIALGFYAAQGF